MVGEVLSVNGSIATMGLTIKFPQAEKGNNSKIDNFITLLSMTSARPITINNKIEIIPLLKTRLTKNAIDKRQKHLIK
jgi:hypothetical protein